MAKDTQRHAYQITLNNPVEKGLTHDKIKEILIKQFSTLQYFCMADEVGKEGTYHTHVYVYFGSRVRFTTVKKHFEKAHIEAAAGDSQQNRDYIRKAGKWEDTDKSETSVPNTFEEWGELPTSRGMDYDMQELYRLVSEGYSDGEILAYNHDYVRFIDLIMKLRKTLLIEKYKGKRRTGLIVHYLSGSTGTCKTRSVLDKEGDANVYRVTDYDHPFDSYSMQPVLCLDEFRDSIKLGAMLDIIDIYPLELPARYANRVACYETVYIVSNWPLEDQYHEAQMNKPQDWQSFLRRIHTVTVYHANGMIDQYDSVKAYFDRDKPPVQQVLEAPDWTDGKAEDMAGQDIPF